MEAMLQKDPWSLSSMTIKLSQDVISILFSSDHHFGAPRMDQSEMAQAFAETIFPLLPEADILFLNGDFFDRLVVFDHHGFDPIYDTILELFQMCEIHGVILRVMQGTYTHDLGQLKRFNAFYRNHHLTFDFRFIDTITLEEIACKGRSLRVFYLPDDLPYKNSQDVVEVLEDQLRTVGWDWVDYGCIHGFFDFTFPKGISQDHRVVFRKEQFPFVRKVIDVGHVHQYREDCNVISNGSFDRLSYGDEDPKGCIRVFDHVDRYTAQFIENTHAAIYDTLTFKGSDDTTFIRETVLKHLASLTTKRKISIRFVVESNGQFEAIREWMREAYPDIRCDRKTVKDAEKEAGILALASSNLIAPSEARQAPTRRTIVSYIRNHIPETYALTSNQIESYLEPTPV